MTMHEISKEQKKYQERHDKYLMHEAYKSELVELKLKRAEKLKKISDALNGTDIKIWSIPQRHDLREFLTWSKRVGINIRSSLWIRKIPFASNYAIRTPLYYAFIFMPDNNFTMIAKEQKWNNTLPLKTRTFQVNPAKIWRFNNQSVLFYRHDCSEPLSVSKDGLIEYDPMTLNPEVYKANLECHHASDILKSLNGGMLSSNFMKFALIAVVIVILYFVAVKMGWLPSFGG